MEIKYLGHSCFAITSKVGITVVTDPYTGVGYELPCGLTADVVTVSHGHFDHNYTAGVQARTFLTTTESFASQGVEIHGIITDHDEKGGSLRGKNIVYIIKMDGMTICHLGDIGEPCSSSLVEKIGKVDVLLLPVGGMYTIDAVEAREYVEALSPKLVIPMHYRPKDGSLDITGAEPFLELCENFKANPFGVARIDERTKGVLYMERVKR